LFEDEVRGFMGIRVGIVGCGEAGRGHVRGYLENGFNVRGIYLCDIDRVKAVNVANSFGIPNENVFYGDKCYLDLIGKVDVISITTPPFERLRIVEDLSSHVRGILIEKPIAHRVEDAIKIVNALKGYGVVGAMVYNLRFSPIFNHLRSVVREDSIVSIYHEFGFDYFNSSGWRGRSDLGGDHVVELDIHVIDYVRYLLGEPKVIHSCGYECVDDGMCRDVYATFYLDRSTAYVSIRHGSGRSGDRFFYMDIGIHNPMDISYRAFTDWPNFRLFHGSEEVSIEEPHVWRNIYITNIIRNFINSIKGVESPRASVIDGYRDLVIAYAIRRSIREGSRFNRYIVGVPIEIKYVL